MALKPEFYSEAMKEPVPQINWEITPNSSLPLSDGNAKADHPAARCKTAGDVGFPSSTLARRRRHLPPGFGTIASSSDAGTVQAHLRLRIGGEG